MKPKFNINEIDILKKGDFICECYYCNKEFKTTKKYVKNQEIQKKSPKKSLEKILWRYQKQLKIIKYDVNFLRQFKESSQSRKETYFKIILLKKKLKCQK